MRGLDELFGHLQQVSLKNLDKGDLLVPEFAHLLIFGAKDVDEGLGFAFSCLEFSLKIRDLGLGGGTARVADVRDSLELLS